MNCTILLLSVDEAPLLAHSLPAALAQGPTAEVTVVDNGSSDATGEMAARHRAGYMRLEPRHTYAAAINRALAQTEGEAVLLLNADCVLDAGFLSAALPRLSEPAVGAVAPKLLRAARPQDPAQPPRELGEIDAAGMFVDRRRKNGLVGFGRPAGEYIRRADAFGPDGAAALYRRHTLEQCALPGGEVLDEDMELWASDADLAWRAQLLGWRCVYEPGALAHHIRTYSPMTRDEMSERSRRLQFRNRYLMMAKNETVAGMLRHAPAIASYELLALGHVLMRERHLLYAYGDAWRLLPGARRRRRIIQARRRVAVPPFGLRPPR